MNPETSNDGEEFFLEDTDPRPLDFRRANGAPMVRRADGSGRWDRYARPSGFGDDLDEQSNLVNWRIDRAMEGVATFPALSAAVAAGVGRKEGRKERREQAITLGRGEEAADLGTALHAMAHRLETEAEFRAPPPYDADLAAYVMALDQAGLEPTHFEVHLCSDTWRAAGTADRIYRLGRELLLPDGSVAEPGTSFIGDLKTGKIKDYSLPGHVIQLAIYCDSQFYDVVTDERTNLPDGLHTGWGLLVHLPVGTATCTLLWADLQVGRVGADLVRQVRRWRKREDFAYEFTFPESDEVAVLSSPIYDLEQEVVDFAEIEIEENEAWRLAMIPWARSRINTIGCHSDARAMLLRRWPVDIPPAKLADDWTSRQVARVLDFLDTIEGAFNLPYPEGDPRVEWDRGLHHTEVEHGNEPRSNVQ